MCGSGGCMDGKALDANLLPCCFLVKKSRG